MSLPTTWGRGRLESVAPAIGEKILRFFEMSAPKIFRKGEANQQSI